jgi:heme-degrading monooxygenase HmoA
MIVASFVFRQHTLNQDFTALDEEIMRRAQTNPGFVKKTKWQGADGETIRVDYYFRDKDSLQRFRADEVHRVAKKRYAEWYSGFAVEIFEVIHSYGDGKLKD